MNKTSNKSVMAVVIFTLLFAVYNACLFIIAGFEDHYASFWASYIFMVLAFVDIAVVGIVFKSRGYKAKDWYLAYPVSKHLVIYVIVEFILSITFMLLDQTDCPPWIAIVLQMVVLAFHIVMVVLCFMSTETIRETHLKVKDKTTFTRLLQADAESCAAKINDPEVKAAFLKFAEQVRFSDPMSNENLFELEKMIALQISNAEACIAMNDLNTALQCCERASAMLIERNKKCIALK